MSDILEVNPRTLGDEGRSPGCILCNQCHLCYSASKTAGIRKLRSPGRLRPVLQIPVHPCHSDRSEAIASEVEEPAVLLLNSSVCRGGVSCAVCFSFL